MLERFPQPGVITATDLQCTSHGQVSYHTQRVCPLTDKYVITLIKEHEEQLTDFDILILKFKLGFLK